MPLGGFWPPYASTVLRVPRLLFAVACSLFPGRKPLFPGRKPPLRADVGISPYGIRIPRLSVPCCLLPVACCLLPVAYFFCASHLARASAMAGLASVFCSCCAI